MFQDPRFLEIISDSSKLSGDLREIQKTVQNYGNRLNYVPKQFEETLKKQEKILVTLKDIQTRVQKLELQLSPSKKTSGGRLPSSFGIKHILHQKGKIKMVQKSLTEEGNMINLIKAVSESKTL